jgi:hypothetical protein
MLGRVISFGGTDNITDMIALHCADVLGTIALERIINLGVTTNTGTIVHVTL